MSTQPLNEGYPADRGPQPADADKASATLARKASLNSVASALDYGTRVLVSFLVKPLLVASLGAWGYGAWELLARLSGYVGPATGKAGHALRSTIAKQQHSTDYDEKRSSVGSATAVCLLLAPIAGVFTFGLAWWSPYWLDAPAHAVWPIRVTAMLLGINVILTQLIDLPRSVLEGENLGYKRMGVSALLVAIGGLLTVIAIHSDFGLIGIAVAMVTNTCLTGIFFIYIVRSYVPWFGIVTPTWQAVRSFLGLSGWFLGWNTIIRLMRASDVIVLGLLASVELVSTYTLTKYAPEVAINLVAIIVFGITPGLGGILGKGNLALAARIRAEIMAMTWLISTALGSATLMWNEGFLRLWVGGEFDAGATSTLLIVLMVTQFVLIRSDASIISLTLDLRDKVLLGIVAAIASLLSAVLLVSHFDMGIAGLCLGIIAGRVILSVGYPWIMGRHLGISMMRQLLGAVRPALLTAICFYVAMNVGAMVAPTNWLALALGVLATLVVLPVPLFYLGLPSSMRTRLGKRVRDTVSRQS